MLEAVLLAASTSGSEADVVDGHFTTLSGRSKLELAKLLCVCRGDFVGLWTVHPPLPPVDFNTVQVTNMAQFHNFLF